MGRVQVDVSMSKLCTCEAPLQHVLEGQAVRLKEWHKRELGTGPMICGWGTTTQRAGSIVTCSCTVHDADDSVRTALPAVEDGTQKVLNTGSEFVAFCTICHAALFVVCGNVHTHLSM